MVKLIRSFFFLFFIAGSFALAQTATSLIEDITVSANKIEENIKDVPQSITVINEETIEQKGIKNIDDVIKEVPNMNGINGMNGGTSSFRGLNTSMFTNNNPVVIYVDGVPYYDRFDYNPSLANVEQIEVLRGPQGTLYGKDAIGAVINIVTKTPTNEWKGSIGAEYGKYNTLNSKVYLSGAILDNKLFAGINNSFDYSDGWIKNHYSSMDKHASKQNNRKTSGFLLYKPTDALLAKLTLTDNYKKGHFMDGFRLDPNSNVNSFKRKDAKDASFDVPTVEDTKVKSQALNLAYELEKVQFTSTTTHKKVDVDGEYDADFTSNTIEDGLRQWNYTDIDTWTQEFKLSSKNQNIKWVTGLYFDKEKREQGPYGAEQSYYGGVYYANADNVTDSKTQAIFGQVMIPLGESFELTLGGRYQRIKKEISADIENILSGTGMFDFNNSLKYDDEKTWHTFLPKAALSYKINDNLTTYVSVSKGYMPGGFNYFPSTNESKSNTFDPQTSMNYEVGAKYIGDSFALNAAIFRMDIKDIHIYKTVGVNFVTDNAKKAHTQGIELDGTYFITDNLSISGSLGLIQAKYDDYDTGTKKYDGKRIEDTPKYTASLGISYLADSGVYGRLDFNARGKTSYFDGANEKMIKTDGAIISNAKIGYKVKGFDIYGFITNITDEDYITFYQSKQGLAMAGFNEPRRFGIGAIYKF